VGRQCGEGRVARPRDNLLQVLSSEMTMRRSCVTWRDNARKIVCHVERQCKKILSLETDCADYLISGGKTHAVKVLCHVERQFAEDLVSCRADNVFQYPAATWRVCAEKACVTCKHLLKVLCHVVAMCGTCCHWRDNVLKILCHMERLQILSLERQCPEDVVSDGR
jgi:hypothetical protein